MRSKILLLAILLTFMVLPFATWLPTHLIAAANPGSPQAEVTVYATPEAISGGGGPVGGGDVGGGGGGGGGGGLLGVTWILNILTFDGRFTEEVTAKSADKNVELFIPKDTIGKNRVGSLISSIRIEKVDDRPPRPSATTVIGEVYEIKPAGATFDPPITLTFKYDVLELPEGVAETNLVLSRWNEADQQWVKLKSNVDLETHTVSTEIGGFSIYAVMAGTLPADLTLADLFIIPEEITVGESASINAVINNTGDLSGVYVAILKIDGIVTQTEKVTIDGHDSKTITFQVVPEVAGEHNISIGTESRSLQVKKPLARTAFTISDLSISPRRVITEESVTISVTVSNAGDLLGTYELILKVDGQVTDTKEVTLNGKESRQVKFILSRDTPGTYIVSFDDHLFGLFRVYPSLAPPETSVILPPTTPVEPPAEPAEPAEQPAIPMPISIRVIIIMIALGVVCGIGITIIIKLKMS